MKTQEILKKYALNYISKYDTTKYNLKKILQKKTKRMNIEKIDQKDLNSIINNILSELELINLIDDKNYTLRRITTFFESGKSKNQIISHLMIKGVKKEIINNVLENFENENPEWEFQSAKKFAIKKKLFTDKKNNKEKSLSKMARAGFNYNICKKILEL